MTSGNPYATIGEVSRAPRRGWWVAALGDPEAAQSPISDRNSAPCKRIVIGAGGRAPSFSVLAESDEALPEFAADHDCGIVFDGVLHNRTELLQQLAPAAPGNDAALILRGYRRWGDDVLTKIKGVFALAIWDCSSDTLLCARDPMGIYPLFYANSDRNTFLSISSEALVKQPGVSPDVNRGLVAAWFVRLFMADGGETFRSAVRRVQMGH